MKISRVYCVAAVTVGVISMALGTSSPNLAARRATAPAPAAAVMSSFDTCLVDAAGNQLIWNSTTGAYTFTRASDGFKLSGTGVVGLVNGIKTLTDFKSDRRISAGLNTGQLTGHAIIYLQVAQGVWQVSQIVDTNPSAQCTLPPVITSFSYSGICNRPETGTITWISTGGTSAVLEDGPFSTTLAATSGSISVQDLILDGFGVGCGETLMLVVTGPGGTTSQTFMIPR